MAPDHVRAWLPSLVLCLMVFAPAGPSLAASDPDVVSFSPFRLGDSATYVQGFDENSIVHFQILDETIRTLDGFGQLHEAIVLRETHVNPTFQFNRTTAISMHDGGTLWSQTTFAEPGHDPADPYVYRSSVEHGWPSLAGATFFAGANLDLTEELRYTPWASVHTVERTLSFDRDQKAGGILVRHHMLEESGADQPALEERASFDDPDPWPTTWEPVWGAPLHRIDREVGAGPSWSAPALPTLPWTKSPNHAFAPVDGQRRPPLGDGDWTHSMLSHSQADDVARVLSPTYAQASLAGSGPGHFWLHFNECVFAKPTQQFIPQRCNEWEIGYLNADGSDRRIVTVGTTEVDLPHGPPVGVVDDVQDLPENNQALMHLLPILHSQVTVDSWANSVAHDVGTFTLDSLQLSSVVTHGAGQPVPGYSYWAWYHPPPEEWTCTRYICFSFGSSVRTDATTGFTLEVNGYQRFVHAVETEAGVPAEAQWTEPLGSNTASTSSATQQSSVSPSPTNGAGIHEALIATHERLSEVPLHPLIHSLTSPPATQTKVIAASLHDPSGQT